MKDILNDFVRGNATTKLSIISNISTILGVSVATFVAGPFLSKFADMEFIVSDFIIAIIFYFIYLWMVASILYACIKEIISCVSDKKITGSITNILFTLFVTWISIITFPYAKYYVGDFFNTSYLLPPPAKTAIEKISKVNIINNDSSFIIQGEVHFNTGIDSTDYELVLYKKYDNGIYKPIVMSNRKVSFRLSKNGMFTMPFDTTYNKIHDPVLVAYRTSDWSLMNLLFSFQGYPEGMTQLPSMEIDSLEAYTFIPKT
ncbi:hypothetical protein [Aeromonas veronii]|uniref:hypothetical protein n=1 Tax=Aeromonas veronii TaxID=654 RepID=UPI003A4DB448